VTPCGPGCRRYRIQGEGTCGSSPPLYTARFDTHAADRLVSARIVEMGADDWVQGRVNHRIIGSAGKRPWLTDSLPSGDCRISGGNWRNHESHDITADLKAGATAVAARVRGGGGSRWGYVDVEIKVDTSCEVIERLVDLCSGYASHPQCRLVSEDVDGVETFRSGVATGLHPLPQTRLFGSASCTLQFTRPFFLRSRRYTCAIDAAALPEPDLSRAAYIIEHSTKTQIADRLPNADGSYATTTRPFAMPERGTVAVCEPVCKTRASRANIAAAPAGVVASQQNDPTGWDIFYHACLPGNLCPVGPGEEIVTSCGCIDDFPDAIVMMQTVRLAGADLACTAETR
jgi:hypothetical protein